MAILTTFLFAGVALAGCLQQEETKGPALVSRVHTVLLNKETTDRLDDFDDDMEGALRELIQTTLVIRADVAGVHTIEYTKEDGSVANVTAALVPGVPHYISDADALAPVVVKRDGAAIAVRAGVPGNWFHVGDVPLGFNLSSGAKATYDFKQSAQEKISLHDYTIKPSEDNPDAPNVQVKTASFDIRLPVNGKASWTYGGETPDGNELHVKGNFEVPAASDLATVDIDAVMNGEPGTAGVIAGVKKATGSGAIKFWWKDGEPVAFQSMGGDAALEPAVIAWADGFFEELANGGGSGFTCAGASKADRCEPTEIESFEESAEADEKEELPVEDYPRLSDLTDEEERQEAQEMLGILHRLFTIDVQRGDAIHLIIEADSDDEPSHGASNGRGDMRIEFSLVASDLESVTVPAGTFSTLKLVEEIRTTFSLKDITNPGSQDLVLRDFAMNETVARTTFWLDTKTNQPVKMVAETPIQIDPILKRLVNSIDPSAWDDIGGKPIENSQWSITMTASSSYELSEYSPATHFPAIVALGVAHAVSFAFMGLPTMIVTQSIDSGFHDHGYGHAQPAYPDERHRTYEMPPPPTVNMAQKSGVTPGVATFEFTSVESKTQWYELYAELDGESLYQNSPAVCSPPTPTESGSYIACSGNQEPQFGDFVKTGDSISLKGTVGQNFVLMHGPSGTAIFKGTIF